FVDVLARAGAEADMMQAYAALVEALALVLRGRRGDQHPGPPADAVVAVGLVHHLGEAEEGKELAVEIARGLEPAGRDLDVGNAIYFHDAISICPSRGHAAKRQLGAFAVDLQRRPDDLLAMSISTGFVAAGFEPVREAFERNFEDGLELGAGFA